MITKAFILDLFERAVWTFGQGALAALALAWGASGLDQEHLTDWSAWQKLLSAVIVGGVAAVLSLVKSVVAGVKTGTASTSKTVAATAVTQDGGQPPVVVETPTGPVNVESSDPGQHEAP